MNILILGGSLFVGKQFANYIKNTLPHYKVILANRGLSGKCDIKINRDIKDSCSSLQGIYFDIVIDFSCYTLEQFKNTYDYLNFNKYIFISSSAVDAVPFRNVSPQDYEMAAYAMRKKECEDFIIKNIKNYNILRPCYIVGDGDYTNRFTKKDGKYYWKDSGYEMTYFIEVESLSKIILDSFESKDSWVKNPCV